MRDRRKSILLTFFVTSVLAYLFSPAEGVRRPAAQNVLPNVYQNAYQNISRNPLLIPMLIPKPNDGYFKFPELTDAPGIDFRLPLYAVWWIKTENLKSISAASDNVLDLIVVTFEGKVFSVNVETGLKNWETELGGRIVSKTFVEADQLYIVSQAVSANEANIQTDPNKSLELRKNSEPETKSKMENAAKRLTVRSINIKTGLTNWQVETETGENLENAFLNVYETALIVLDNLGNLSSFDKKNGEIRRRGNINFNLSAEPLFSKDAIIVAAVEGPIVFIAPSAGEAVYEMNPNESVTAVNYIERGKTLVWGSRKGSVSSARLNFGNSQISTAKKNKSSKIAWKFRQGAEISDISLTSRGFLVSSFDNFLYLISEKDGSLIWKKRVGGRIASKPLINGNYIVTTNTAESSASILGLESGRTVNKINLPEDTLFIGQPLIVGGKILLTTQNGVYAFGSAEVGK